MNRCWYIDKWLGLFGSEIICLQFQVRVDLLADPSVGRLRLESQERIPPPPQQASPLVLLCTCSSLSKTQRQEFLCLFITRDWPVGIGTPSYKDNINFKMGHRKIQNTFLKMKIFPKK